MRSGRLRHRVDFLARLGEDPPVWSSVANVWTAIEPPRNAGAAEQTGIRSPVASLVKARYNSGIEVGQILRHDGRYWSVDAINNIDNKNAELLITAREYIGFSAVYTPAAGGGSYNCIAFPVRDNVWIGDESNHNDPRMTLELLELQLTWPWGIPKDQITIQGSTKIVTAIDRGSQDGRIVRLFVR